MSSTTGALFHPAPPLEPSFSWDPLPLVAVALVFAGYSAGLSRLWASAGVGRGVRIWQAASFGLCLLTLLVALVSPLDFWSDRLFSAHMAQHELLMVVAAPLGVLGRPLTAYAWALPARARGRAGKFLQRAPLQLSWQFVSAPLLVLVLHAALRWLWHVPLLFEAAMRDEWLHALQHLTFFASAALFWWALVHGRYGKAGYGLAVMFVFATALHTSVLGALLGVAPRVIYTIYEARAVAAGWHALEDQALGGLLMWVPSGVLLTVSGLALFGAWLGEAERRAARSQVRPLP